MTRVLPVLMLLATVAFVIGVSIERRSGHTESTSEHTASHESGEAAEHTEGAHGEAGEGHVVEPRAEKSETIAGIDVESTPIVAVAVVVSLGLAGAALRWPRREMFAVAATFCVAFAILDGREFAHQLDEQAGGVATFAALALLFHLAAAGVAILGLARGRTEPAPAAVG